MLAPVRSLNSSVARCGTLPLPGDPYVSSPGLDFASATSSCGVLAGNAAFAVRISGDSLDHALAALRKKAKTPKAAPEPRKNLVQLFAESPLAGSELTFDRDRDFGRDVEL